VSSPLTNENSVFDSPVYMVISYWGRKIWHRSSLFFFFDEVYVLAEWHGWHSMVFCEFSLYGLANPNSLSINSLFFSRFCYCFCSVFQKPWAAGQNLKCPFPLHYSLCCFTWCVWCCVQFTSLYARQQKVYAISAVCPG